MKPTQQAPGPATDHKQGSAPSKRLLWSIFTLLMLLWLILRTFTYVSRAADLLLMPAIGIQAWLLNYERIH